MRNVIAASLALLVCPGLAFAQSPQGSPGVSLAQSSQATPGAPAPHTPVPPATAGVLAEQPHPVPGVTVTGRRLKPCAPRDQACIETISKEIWTRYPKQIETLCTHESIRLMQQGFQMEELGEDTTEINTRLTPQTKDLCDYGKKIKTQAAAAKSSTSAASQPATADSDGSAKP